jgi:hypothetical protein
MLSEAATEGGEGIRDEGNPGTMACTGDAGPTMTGVGVAARKGGARPVVTGGTCGSVHWGCRTGGDHARYEQDSLPSSKNCVDLCNTPYYGKP